MKRAIYKDKSRRIYYKQSELQKTILKYLLRNHFTSQRIKREVTNGLSEFLRNSSLTRIKNRCIMTGRSRSISRRFRLSRITFRELGSKGCLNGIYKSSW